MKLRISATEAAATFPQLVQRIRDRGDAYIVVEDGKDICAITPAEQPTATTLGDFLNLLKSLGPVDQEYLDVVEAHINDSNRPTVPRSPWES